MWIKAIAAARYIFTIILIVLFTKLFGIVQIQTYLKKEVLVKVDRTRYPDGAPAPSMTVCAFNGYTKLAWKDYFSLGVDGSSFYDICNGTENVTACVLNKTYNIGEFIVDSEIINNFTNKITAAQYGNCVSLETDQRLHSKIGDSEIKLNLKNNKYYIIFFYDPKFFFLSENPSANPGLKIKLDVYEMSTIRIRYLKFEIIQHEKLNLESKPCVEDEEYIFGNCLRDVIEADTGCRLPWHDNLPEEGESFCCFCTIIYLGDLKTNCILG